MSEAWRGCFCVMLSVKGASKKLQKGKTFIYRSGLVFTVEGEEPSLGTSQTLKLSVVASAKQVITDLIVACVDLLWKDLICFNRSSLQRVLMIN